MFVPFCRVNPHDHAVPEAERALAAGARGIKLHPRAEEFTLDHPAVRSLFALAHERSLPILIHARSRDPALGVHVAGYAKEFPDARVILAHAGVSDLAWIWRAAAELPNLLFDTAWWIGAGSADAVHARATGADRVRLRRPATDTPRSALHFQFRLALQAGLSAEQIRMIAASANRCGSQPVEPLEPAGPAVGERDSRFARPAGSRRRAPPARDDAVDPRQRWR